MGEGAKRTLTEELIVKSILRATWERNLFLEYRHLECKPPRFGALAEIGMLRFHF